MSVIVHKFGGSCLRAEHDLERISGRLEQATSPPIVVVSALWGVTDHLLKAIESPHLRQTILDEIRTRHLTLAPSLSWGVDAERFEATMKNLDAGLRTIAKSPPGTKQEEMVLACGERLSSLVVAESLRDEGHPARAIWAEDLGIIVEGEGNQRSIDLELTKMEFDHSLLEGVLPVITGWYGTHVNGDLAILDRGGSDVTAAALALILHADSLILWKDVVGVLAIHPRWGVEGKRIPYLGYTEAAELARLGTTILHPSCVEPVAMAGIPIILTSLHAGGEGTTVGPDLHLEQVTPRALTCNSEMRVITAEGGSRLTGSGYSEMVSDALNSVDIDAWSVQAVPGRVEVIVHDVDSSIAFQAINRIRGMTTSMGNVNAILSLVGIGISEQTENVLEKLIASEETWSKHLRILGRGRAAIHLLLEEEMLSPAIRSIASRLGLSEENLIF